MLTNERYKAQTEWNGRTGVCRDGTMRQNRPMRDKQTMCDEQKHQGGRYFGNYLLFKMIFGYADFLCPTRECSTIV
jgi:hypothetical protein